MREGTGRELLQKFFPCNVASISGNVLKAGDVVVMDNLSAHKSSRITKSIEERGANILYLLPYSPGLNPIEKITPLEAKNWFKSCGYYS